MAYRKSALGIALLFWLCWSAALALKVSNLPQIKLPSGSKENQVCNVKAIYVGPGGEIYVGSACNNKVQVFSSNGQYLRTIPPGKKQDIDVAQDIEVGIDGSVYVVDRDRKELVRFDQSGMRVGTIGGKKAFKRPMSVSVSRDGTIYIADENLKNVSIFEPSGQALGSLQGPGFTDPVAVDVDHQGRIFVLDRGRRSVSVFAPDGSMLGDLPVAFGGQAVGDPIDMCVNQNGELFVLDAKNLVVYFCPDYASREWFPPFGGSGTLDKPVAIDVAGRDICYVLDNKGDLIRRFKLDDMPKLTQDTTIAQTIINRAVIASNIDTLANIKIHKVDPATGQIVLSVFENNRNIAAGLRAENFPTVTVGGQTVKIASAKPLAGEQNIDFIFIIGTEKLKDKDVQAIRDDIRKEFLQKLDEAKNRVAVFTFAPEVKLAMPLESSFSKQKALFEKLPFNGEKAPMYDALLAAINYYDTVSTKAFPIFVLVTNTTGTGSRNDYGTLEEYQASKSMPQIYVLFYDSAKKPDWLSQVKKVADLSGGFFYSSDQADMLYFLFRRAWALVKGEYLVQAEGLPGEGELAVNVDIDLDGNLYTTKYEYSGPTGAAVKVKGAGFFEKYGLIILIVLLAVLLLIIIIAIVVKARERGKPPVGEAVLEVKSGSAPQKQYQLRKGPNSIGTAKENEIVLPLEGVSRKHAVIEYANGKYELVDSDSTNGTYVNKNRVTRRTLINNDVIAIGAAVEFVFKSG